MPITIYFIYKKNGKYYEGQNHFNDPVQALRFMHKTKDKFYHFEWQCDDPWDNEWLWTHWKN